MMTLYLFLITACLVALTVTAILTAIEVRRTLRRVNAILPEAERALQEAHHAFRHSRRVLAGAARTTQYVETVAQQLCEAASDALHRVSFLRNRAAAWIAGHVGNGTGAEPRSRGPHARKRGGHRG
jgi:hypothetical protein